MTTTDVPPGQAPPSEPLAERLPPTGEDPRFLARRLAVRRAADRKRVRILLAIIGVLVASGFAYLAVESPALDVDHVRVVGAEQADADEVVAAAGDLVGRPLLRIDTGAVARRVEALPWVADARVVRKLPGTLRIEVTEFDAVAYVRRANGRAALLAEDGRVVADVDVPPAGVVEVLGLRRPPRVGGVVSPPGAAGVLLALPESLSSRVVAIDLSGGGVALDLDRGGEVRLGSLDELEAKGAAAVAVLGDLGDAPFAYVDVRVPQAPVVK